MSFETVIEFNDERMIQHCHNRLLVFDNIFFLIFANKAFQHDFHGIELSISETSHQINFTKTSDGQTFADFIPFETTLRHVFQTVEGSLSGENTLTNRDLIVKEDILVD